MLESGDFKSGNDFLTKSLSTHKFEPHVESLRSAGMVRHPPPAKLEIISSMEGSNSDSAALELPHAHN